MINKLLIANRGEIAARIIRTCKKMGIQTVAVYSEADQHAPYVAMADESFSLGGPRPTESYMNAGKIIGIAKEAGVDAIHPGYGFLSENGAFAKSVEEAGFIFIGPDSDVIDQMGRKIAARKIMAKAGLPIIPGTDEAVQTSEEAVMFAKQVGYPVMLKASAGGGGIGLQVVHSDDELVSIFENNLKRAQTFFGDGSMFIEKQIANARHVEIQLLADHYGNVIHLFDRECSIQRRNQKIIEEAPSPFISEKTRQAMAKAAVHAAKSLGYTNSGTIEFLVDDKERFYFLEMNTRIQVEHPVTEEITGIDIIAEQINIAAGKQISRNQEAVVRDGHAIEARIYAEDPKTFFPSPGHIKTFKIPESEHVRLETAVKENYDVTPYYDPMICKLVTRGKTRKEAISHLHGALNHLQIEGIKTNIPMLLNIVNHDEFQKGNTTTAFIQKHYLPSTK